MTGSNINTPQRIVQRVMVEVGILKVLRREAAQRETSVDRLISDLLNVTAADGLVTAVLDDVDQTATSAPK